MSEQLPPFDADVRIGKGMRPIAQHGRLTIDNGGVTLFNSNSKVVASAPVADVTGKKAPFPLHGLRLTVSGVTYTLDATTKRWQTIGVGRVGAGSVGKTTSFIKVCLDYLAAVQA